MRRLAIILLALVLAGGALVGGAAYWALQRLEASGPLTEPTVFTVERGQGVRELATALQQAGAVDRDWMFLLAALRADAETALQAGEYELPAGASPLDLVALFRSGQVVLHPITVPEGLTVAEVVALLAGSEVLTGTVDTLPPEGSLLPETYKVTRGTARQVVIDRMRAAMRETLAGQWEMRADGLPYDTAQEALTMASIVEKETAIAAEREAVAGVFVNRLERGMRLQADPTVVYALTEGAGPLGRPLTRADWRVEHPYNTYQITGLPPGPIANPGAASIAAALNPERHGYLYFVADGTGGHVFARTLAEHNRNVARWRRIRDAAE